MRANQVILRKSSVTSLNRMQYWAHNGKYNLDESFNNK